MDNLVTFCIPSARGESHASAVLNNLLISKDTFSFDIFLLCNGWTPSLKLIDLLERNNIKYIVNSAKLEIDESHRLSALSIESKYIFFLGDDDYIGVKSIETIKIFSLFDLDLVVINKDSAYRITKLISGFDNYFLEIHDKCTLGRVLIKHSLYDFNDNSFIGTSHWYTSFLSNLINRKHSSIALISGKDDFLQKTVTKKTYLSRIFSVYFIDIPSWYKLLIKKSQLTGRLENTSTIKKAYLMYYRSLLSPRFFLYILFLLTNKNNYK